jgi:hypothetical protein
MTTLHFSAQHDRPATDKQIDFIAVLAQERDWDAIDASEGNVHVKASERFQQEMSTGITMRQASRYIEWLKGQPRLAQRRSEDVGTTTAGTPIPDGYYCVPMEGHKNDVTFYRLRTGKRGSWKGFQFVDLLASTTPYPVKGKDARQKVFDAILLVGVTSSRELFGQKLGRCGCCNRPLTDEQSRARGIGPECAKGL